jgi:cyclomaltodextrinase / maltogenic alpha-amylase / neopullulanase
VPVTFQGDECAFLGTGTGPRERNRYPLQWQDCEAGMVAHYVQLAQLRDGLEALRSPVIRLHHGAGGLVSFFRGEPGPGEVLAVFNSGQTTGALPRPEGTWLDAVTGAAVAASVAVEPLGWRLLRRE